MHSGGEGVYFLVICQESLTTRHYHHTPRRRRLAANFLCGRVSFVLLSARMWPSTPALHACELFASVVQWLGRLARVLPSPPTVEPAHQEMQVQVLPAACMAGEASLLPGLPGRVQRLPVTHRHVYPTDRLRTAVFSLRRDFFGRWASSGTRTDTDSSLVT